MRFMILLLVVAAVLCGPIRCSSLSMTAAGSTADLLERIFGYYSNDQDVVLGLADQRVVHFVANISSRVANISRSDNVSAVVLGESYVTDLTTGQVTPKPFLHLLTTSGNENAFIFVMHAFLLPEDIPVNAWRINNTALRLNYASLVRDPTFGPAPWIYNPIRGAWEFLSSAQVDGIAYRTHTVVYPYRLDSNQLVTSHSGSIIVAKLFVRVRRIPHTFAMVVSALMKGYAISHTVSYVHCPPYEAKHARAGFARDSFVNFVSSSARNVVDQLTFGTDLVIQNYQGPGYVYDVGQLHLFSNNSVNIFAADIDSQTIEPYYTEVIRCMLRDPLMESGAVVFFTSMGIPTPLTSFNQVVSALQQSVPVRLVYDWRGCTNFTYDAPNSSSSLEDLLLFKMVRGVTTIQVWEYFLNLPPMPFVSSSRRRILPIDDDNTANSTSSSAFVEELLRISIYSDGTLHSNLTLLSPHSMMYLASLHAVCEIQKTSSDSAVTLFGLMEP